MLSNSKSLEMCRARAAVCILAVFPFERQCRLFGSVSPMAMREKCDATGMQVINVPRKENKSKMMRSASIIQKTLSNQPLVKAVMRRLRYRMESLAKYTPG